MTVFADEYASNIIKPHYEKMFAPESLNYLISTRIKTNWL